jgi:hypothetical protein
MLKAPAGAAALLLWPILFGPVLLAQNAGGRIDVSTLGPQVGDRVPEFALPDQNGTVRTLESILGSRGAVLVFIRSADW